MSQFSSQHTFSSNTHFLSQISSQTPLYILSRRSLTVKASYGPAVLACTILIVQLCHFIPRGHFEDTKLGYLRTHSLQLTQNTCNRFNYYDDRIKKIQSKQPTSLCFSKCCLIYWSDEFDKHYIKFLQLQRYY